MYINGFIYNDLIKRNMKAEYFSIIIKSVLLDLQTVVCIELNLWMLTIGIDIYQEITVLYIKIKM